MQTNLTEFYCMLLFFAKISFKSKIDFKSKIHFKSNLVVRSETHCQCKRTQKVFMAKVL